MNESQISPDDPRLTAYALGELEGDERAEIEAAVCAHPALRAQVDQIRALAGQLESALAAEAAMPLALPSDAGVAAEAARLEDGEGDEELPVGSTRGAPVATRDADGAVRQTTAYGRPRGKVIRFPYFYYIAGGLAAACLAVVVALNRDDYEARQRVREENLRVALEKRAAEANAAANARVATGGALPMMAAGESAAASEGTLVVADAVSVPATEATPAAVASATEAATQKSESTGVAFAPGGLGLLQQVGHGPAQFTLGSATASSGGNARMVGRVERAGSSGAVTVAQAVVSSVPASDTVPQDQAITLALNYGATTQPVETRYAVGGQAETVGGTLGGFSTLVTSSGPATGYSKTPTPGSDVVTLSAFTVSAEKTASYGAMTSAARKRSDYEPYADERDYRPRPPLGARFGRKPDSVARDNDFLRAAFYPLSTFSVEVDAASYGNVRRALARGELPARDAVRIEEMLNYFPYRYPGPVQRRLSFFEKLGGEDAAPPFAASLEVAEAPWAPKHRLVRIGLKGREVPNAERPGANLVFLVDVSSSMNEPGKLPLMKESLRLLVGKLRPDDRIAIVTYGGNAGVALASTPVAREREIVAAIDGLVPSGVADGATGIRQAYEIAQANYADGGINRVILCTDGDFNVGTASESELMRLVETKVSGGVFLTVLGFGMGDYRDATLEKLADRGNGNYGYIDSRREAQKLLVDEVSSTLVTIAKDVKVQVEFNPAKVSSYRLIGYENRLLRKEDFNTDDVDAGEIGAGHTVTALYEIVPVGAESPVVAGARPLPDEELKYVSYATDDAFSSRLAMPTGSASGPSDELLTVKVRYKKPDGLIGLGRTTEFALKDAGKTFAEASADFRFAAAVAQFGMILRKSVHRGTATIGDVIAWAAAAAANPADDPGGYRGEFIDLARQAQELLRRELERGR